ncbi:MAG: OpgC domain-containing protein [Afipia sp.]|nr:OpgC domain-containing protein [Afipia sp.]
MANENKLPLLPHVERDLRLDLFRGIGLWMIFLDHVPDNFVAWLTLRNYGFSDAAELFVFISGYLAGFIYGPIIGAGQFVAAAKRLWTRVWQMYVAHIMLFLLFTAQIARAIRKFDNPMYADEFNVRSFLENPDVLIGQALTLRYKPVDLDVLPLYMTLIAASPLILWCLLRRPNATLLGSVLLYICARYFDWNLPSYPAGATWYFNPFAWQLMFVFGAWCGVGGVKTIWPIIESRIGQAIAILWIAFALVVVMTWRIPVLDAMVPKWFIKAIYPIDKTNLDMLRFTHFLAVALLVARFFPRRSDILSSKWLHPIVLCGQHSLPLFCFGVFLSFGSHWILVQYSNGLLAQFAVSFGGIAVMIALAWLLERSAEVPNLFVDTSDKRKPAKKLIVAKQRR